MSNKWYTVQYEVSTFSKERLDKIEQDLKVLEKYLGHLFCFDLDNEYLELRTSDIKILNVLDENI